MSAETEASPALLFAPDWGTSWARKAHTQQLEALVGYFAGEGGLDAWLARHGDDAEDLTAGLADLAAKSATGEFLVQFWSSDILCADHVENVAYIKTLLDAALTASHSRLAEMKKRGWL